MGEKSQLTSIEGASNPANKSNGTFAGKLRGEKGPAQKTAVAAPRLTAP
jgi:hypothetical protein